MSAPSASEWYGPARFCRGSCCQTTRRFRRQYQDLVLMPVGRLHGRQVPRDAGLDLLNALLQLGGREVLVPVVDRLELAAIDRDQGFGEQDELAAQQHELAAGRPD